MSKLVEDIDRERKRQIALGFDYTHDKTHTDDDWEGILQHYYRRVEEAATGDAVMNKEIANYNLTCLMAAAAARATAKGDKLMIDVLAELRKSTTGESE